MPKSAVVDQDRLLKEVCGQLAATGPAPAKKLCDLLTISQPTMSRLMKRAESSILRIGRGPQTLYACPKIGRWGKPHIPIYIVDESGKLSQVATLHPLSPRGFYIQSSHDFLTTRAYEDLPYFFEDARPSGFLGRLIPKHYPDLGFPEDITRWSDEDFLVYLTRCGWDLIGHFILGEKSCDDYLASRVSQVDVVEESQRKTHYPRVAELVLSQGYPGSSAAGEHPKFLAIRKTQKGPLPVMVKFSPPIEDAISRRVADLLICEHVAHEVLKKHGKVAPRSSLLSGKGRLFLEIERFDRNQSAGRIGVLSLRALDLEFVGQLRSWSETAETLCAKKIIDPETYETIVWLEVFGKLIGNTDRHHGNISFFSRGEKVMGLTPVYDMLPMMYAPQQNQLMIRSFDPPPPKSREIIIWNSALSAAQDFWDRVQKHARISREFKKLTDGHAATLAGRRLV